MPSFRVPVLEFDGKKMPETMSIARYLAREYGFYPKNNNMDMFRVDYICESLYEIMHDYMRYFHEKSGHFRKDNNMAEQMQRHYMETIRRILPFLERTLEMRDGGNKFFMGDQMMMCDMMLYCFFENPMMENQSMFSQFPKLMALYKRVAAHPKISAYMQKRQNTNW